MDRAFGSVTGFGQYGVKVNIPNLSFGKALEGKLDFLDYAKYEYDMSGRFMWAGWLRTKFYTFLPGETKLSAQFKFDICLGQYISIFAIMYYSYTPQRNRQGQGGVMPSRRIYVGNLPRDVQKMEVLELFEKFGKICFADLKGGRTGPPFAFIEYEDYRDAEDAISQRDGYKFDGCRLRVEFPKGEMRGRGGAYVGGGGNGGGRGYGYNNDYGNGNNNRRFQQRRSQYRLQVSGLPPGSSWQDLKDHMREVGEVCYAEVRKDGSGTGIVEFLHNDDMKEAIRKLNDTQLRSHEGSSAYIRLKDYDNRSDSRSRSYSPKQRESRRRRSPTRSRSRSSGEDKQAAAMAKPEGKRPRGRSDSRS